MKNYFLLSLILFGSIVQGYSMDDLEEAIEDSKLRHVKIILPKIQLTQKDKFRLFHLTHDVLCFRKDAQEIGNMGGAALDKKDAVIAMLGMASFIAGGSIMMTNQNPFYGFSLSLGTIVAMFCGSLYRHIKRVKKLAKKYHNALKIKQFLMAYDDGDEKFL